MQFISKNKRNSEVNPTIKVNKTTTTVSEKAMELLGAEVGDEINFASDPEKGNFVGKVPGGFKIGKNRNMSSNKIQEVFDEGLYLIVKDESMEVPIDEEDTTTTVYKMVKTKDQSLNEEVEVEEKDSMAAATTAVFQQKDEGVYGNDKIEDDSNIEL